MRKACVVRSLYQTSESVSAFAANSRMVTVKLLRFPKFSLLAGFSGAIFRTNDFMPSSTVLRSASEYVQRAGKRVRSARENEVDGRRTRTRTRTKTSKRGSRTRKADNGQISFAGKIQLENNEILEKLLQHSVVSSASSRQFNCRNSAEEFT